MRLVRRALCTGCTACYNACNVHAIEMIEDKDGFLYPFVDEEKCTDCGRCQKSCPELNLKYYCKEDTANNEAYACYTTDHNIRISSSSGGLFTALAQSVLEENGCVYGVVYNPSTYKTDHVRVETVEELEAIRGSKYMQSTLGSTFSSVKKDLKDKKRVLFSGTPCQVSGLKSFLNEEDENLLCVDFICYGIPSYKTWKNYIEEQEIIHKSKHKAIGFREKTDGWINYFLKIAYSNDVVYHQSFKENPFMKAFLNGLCLRDSCYRCKYKGQIRHSDITIADFWGVQHVRPDIDFHHGVSLVWYNGSLGKKVLYNSLMRLESTQVDLNEALRYNLSALKSAKRHNNRRSFMKQSGSIPFEELVDRTVRRSYAQRYLNKTKRLFEIMNMQLRKKIERIKGAGI